MKSRLCQQARHAWRGAVCVWLRFACLDIGIQHGTEAEV